MTQPRFKALITIGAGGSYGNSNDLETAINNALEFGATDFCGLFDLHRKDATVYLYDRETEKEWTVTRQFPITRIDNMEDLADAMAWVARLEERMVDDDQLINVDSDANRIVEWLEDAIEDGKSVPAKVVRSLIYHINTQIIDKIDQRLELIYAEEE